MACRAPSLAGYAFARLRRRGGAAPFTMFLVGPMVPFPSIRIPLYSLMRAFFVGLPGELADAAEMDGCTELGVFWRVMLRQSALGLSTLAVLQFILAWKEFLIPLPYLQREESMPVALGPMFFENEYGQNVPLTMAGTTLVMIPIVVAYVFLQRSFVRGLTAGAVEG